MEEDNADDILRWLFAEQTMVDYKGNLKLEKNARYIDCEARLRGNLFGLKPTQAEGVVTEPMLIVCEKIKVEKYECASSKGFRLSYGNEILIFVCSDSAQNDETDEVIDEWILKLSMASYRIIKARYEETMQAHFTPFSDTQSCQAPLAHDNQLKNYFLTSPFVRDHSFSIFQSAAAPNRNLICRETMYETKLSMVIPIEMLKLFLNWANELKDDLLSNLWTVQNSVMVEALQLAIRHLNSNIEVYSQASEFLSTYNVGYFRPSVEKYRVAFATVPTNFHLQYFAVNGRVAASYATVGAIAAFPLRFGSGGLYRMRNKFNSQLDELSLDHTDEARYTQRRTTLIAIKRQIGELSRRLDVEWHIIEFGKIDKIGIQIYTEVKEIYETLLNVVQTFPGVENLVEALCDGGHAQLQRKSNHARENKGKSMPIGPRDTLSNQLEQLEAEMISLGSKMSVIDTIDDDKNGRRTFEDSARTGLHSALDAFHHLTESLLLAQMLGLVLCFRKQADCSMFFQMQLRYDILLSQSLTVVCSVLLNFLDNTKIDDEEANNDTTVKLVTSQNANISPLLITFFSFLSSYGKEQGMLEDMFEILSLFPGVVEFRFVEAGSSVSETCIPHIEGHRTSLRISIPLPSTVLNRIRLLRIELNQWFRVYITFWNVGINHEASLAAKIGGSEFEELINRTALQRTNNYIERYLKVINGTSLSNQAGHGTENVEFVSQHFFELEALVTKNATRKNTAIFPKVMALTQALNGVPVIACKSGKDRTSMALTLEEGRIIKETCGISQHQMGEIVSSLRTNGVRRENCRKNTGKPLYAFSHFQMNFLPQEFRPPQGTYTNLLAS